MRKILVMALMLSLASIGVTSADIVSTSFENDSTGAQYVDTGNALVDHDLVNNIGQADVDSTNTVGDLGFDASYVNSRDGVGLTDGDFVGVTDFTGTVGSFTDGSQGYQISDVDGLYVLTFDTVDLTSITDPVTVSIDYFLASTGWESDDSLRIAVDVDGVITDLINTNGTDIDDLGIEGTFTNLSTTFAGASDATLFVEFDSNSVAEAVFLDNVVFATAVPEPSSIALLGLVGLAGVVRRRK